MLAQSSLSVGPCRGAHLCRAYTYRKAKIDGQTTSRSSQPALPNCHLGPVRLQMSLMLCNKPQLVCAPEGILFRVQSPRSMLKAVPPAHLQPIARALILRGSIKGNNRLPRVPLSGPVGGWPCACMHEWLRVVREEEERYKLHGATSPHPPTRTQTEPSL